MKTAPPVPCRSAQRFRIAQIVAHLRIGEPGMPDRNLSPEQRTTILAALYRGQSLPVAAILKKILKLPPQTDLHTRETDLKGDATAHRLAGAAKLEKPATDRPRMARF